MDKLLTCNLLSPDHHLHFRSLTLCMTLNRRYPIKVQTAYCTVSTVSPQHSLRETRPKVEKSTRQGSPSHPCQSLLVVQGLGQFVQHPVQILVRLPLLLNFVDGVHYGGVVLAPKLAADLRQ